MFVLFSMFNCFLPSQPVALLVVSMKLFSPQIMAEIMEDITFITVGCNQTAAAFNRYVYSFSYIIWVQLAGEYGYCSLWILTSPL